VSRRAVTEVEIEGRRVRLSNVDKVLWPAAGFTKGQMIDYYRRISGQLLPHLQERPLTLKRYPDGVDAEFFYEKRCPSHRPPWIATCSIPRRGATGKPIDYCLVGDLPSLVWVANLASIELHSLLACCRRIDHPTTVVFDLDPGPPADLVDCCQVGLWVGEVLDELGLQSFPKASGSKGLQLFVPLNTPHSYADTKPFARSIARLLAERYPDRVVERMEKSLRAGKVLIDWSQNDASKSTVCAYSLRARERPRVSAPVTWQEVERGLHDDDPALLQFEAGDVIDRVRRLGDLFEPVYIVQQELPRLG
jgi:bifunctional non-homologous end joining protein LigD